MRERTQSQCRAVWRGVPGESQTRRRGGDLLLRVGSRRDSRVQRRRGGRVGRKRVDSGEKGDVGGCPSAFTEISEKSRDRCSWGEFQQTCL